ncbi:MAG: hypothetical protein E6I24_08390 [Chloroflexi bacterium]|nr:MAG: hypothetical protein E6I24_08390 [Chloroflexota bacterium]
MAVLRACRGHALASLLCVFTLAIVSCGSPASQAPTPTPGKVLRGALTVDGVERSYRLFRPSLAAGMKVPLVIVLHEYGTTGEDMSALSLYDQQATKSQFITVYPDGIGGSWNAGACCTPATTRGIDDVKFIGLLIDRVASQEPIDASRVFVVGFSNGAAMTYRLACRHVRIRRNAPRELSSGSPSFNTGDSRHQGHNFSYPGRGRGKREYTFPRQRDSAVGDPGWLHGQPDPWRERCTQDIYLEYLSEQGGRQTRHH